jgi:hypothetical protein
MFTLELPPEDLDGVLDGAAEAFHSGLTKDTPDPNFLYKSFKPWLGSEKKNLMRES